MSEQLPVQPNDSEDTALVSQLEKYLEGFRASLLTEVYELTQGAAPKSTPTPSEPAKAPTPPESSMAKMLEELNRMKQQLANQQLEAQVAAAAAKAGAHADLLQLIVEKHQPVMQDGTFVVNHNGSPVPVDTFIDGYLTTESGQRLLKNPQPRAARIPVNPSLKGQTGQPLTPAQRLAMFHGLA